MTTRTRIPSARSAGKRAADSPAMKWLARAGFVARGIMYAVIGWIALQIAFRHSGQQADKTGALHTLNSTPVGAFALWVLVVGFFGMALWRLSEAIYGASGPDGRKTMTRLGALARTVLYAVTGYGVLMYAIGAGGPQSSNQQSVDLTATLLHHPGGRALVVIIGLALIGRPPLLVLDEPTTGLDPASRKAVWNVLRQTVMDGTTLVFSTHYMEEAERLSDRIAIIDTGRVIAFGTLRELVSRLRDSYRLSYHDPLNGNGHGHMRVQRYSTFADVQMQIQRLRLSEYSIARASLEDVYFELSGHQFQNEDEEEPAEVLQ